jgi:membrane associated rhomboid family serine protease
MADEPGDFFFYQPMVVRKRVVRRRRRGGVRKPRWTIIFIAICVAVYILELLFPAILNLAFYPPTALEQPWTFVTAIFLHARSDPSHLIFNMIALFFFGIYLESRIKPKQFLTIFFAAGILGNVAYLVTEPLGALPAVGASGAVYGIMGMLTALYPGLTVYYFGLAPMPMIFAAFMWFIMEFTGMFIPDLIAHQAHLAGLIIGVLYGLYIRQQKKKVVYFWER